MKSCSTHFPLIRLSAALVPLALLAGCVATQEAAVPRKQEVIAEPDAAGIHRRFITLQQVRPGMTREEVRGVVGGEVVVGYQLDDRQEKYYRPVTVSNPYRRQDLGIGSKTYEVDFYLLGIKAADGEVTDDELVPLVFHNDKLIGSGWPFLNSFKN